MTIKKFNLDPCYAKDAYCINSVNITWVLIRNAESRALLEIYLLLICIFLRFPGNLHIQ